MTRVWDVCCVLQCTYVHVHNYLLLGIATFALGVIAFFRRASTHILRASYSADIATQRTCVVLALVAGRRDCQPRLNSQQQTP